MSNFNPATIDRVSTIGAALRSATGWEIEGVELNEITGFVRLRVSKSDGNRKTLITMLRSSPKARVVIVREIGVRRCGFTSDWWDFSTSTLLERRTADGIRHAMRIIGTYIADNARPLAVEAMVPIRALAVELST